MASAPPTFDALIVIQVSGRCVFGKTNFFLEAKLLLFYGRKGITIRDIISARLSEQNFW